MVAEIEAEAEVAVTMRMTEIAETVKEVAEMTQTEKMRGTVSGFLFFYYDLVQGFIL
jgi:hypothetical protein